MKKKKAEWMLKSKQESGWLSIVGFFCALGVMIAVPPLTLKVVGLGGGLWFGRQIGRKLMPRRLSLFQDRLLRPRFLRKPQTVYLKEVAAISVYNANSNVIGQLEKMDFEQVRSIKEVSKVKINLPKEKSVEIKRTQYNDDDAYNQFILRLQHHYKEQHLPVVEKVARLERQCSRYLYKDQQLAQHLEESILEAYNSVYRLHLAKKKPTRPDLIYHFYKEKKHIYFVENDYLEAIHPEHIELARTLVSTAQSNLEIVKTRISYYTHILEAIRNKKKSLQQFTQLKQIAERLKALQEENIKKQQYLELDNSEVFFNKSILTLLEELTNKVYQLDTLEQSDILEAYIQLLKSDFITENESLKSFYDTKE